MKRKSIKRSALMLSLVMCLTSFAFPLVSGAAADKPGKITFDKAEIKEFTLTDQFKTDASIPASVTTAEFAKINDKVPFYLAVAEIGSDNKNTPLDLKSDTSGKVYCDSIVYDAEDTLSGGKYYIIAVDENLNLKEVNVENTAYPGSTWTIYYGMYSLTYNDLNNAEGTIGFGPIDRGESGKIKLRYSTNYSPFDKVYYKTSSTGEYKSWPVKNGELESLDVPGKYLGIKFTLNDRYKFSYDEANFSIDGIFITSLPMNVAEGEYSLEISDITALSPDQFTSNKVEDYGYFIDVSPYVSYFGDQNTGTSVGESKTGKATFEDKGGYMQITIEDLNIEKGELCLYGLEYGVTPYTLIVKGTNKVDWLVFDTEVTVICEQGATLSYNHFNILEPDPNAPNPPEYKLGDDTVFDKDSSMFKSTTAAATPTSTEAPQPTSAEPTAVAQPTSAEPTAVAQPTSAEPTTVAQPTNAAADPTATPATAATEATATPTTATTEATATPTATPTEDPATVPSDGAIAPSIQAVKIKKDVYFIENGKSATLSGVDLKAKNVTVPATIKANGKTYKVTKIAADTFKKSKAQTITLGKNVTTVEAGAFNNCSRLKTVIFDSGVKELKANIFIKCKKLKTVKFKAKKTVKVDKKAFSGLNLKTLKVYVTKKAQKKTTKYLISAGIKKSNIKKM